MNLLRRNRLLSYRPFLLSCNLILLSTLLSPEVALGSDGSTLTAAQSDPWHQLSSSNTTAPQRDGAESKSDSSGHVSRISAPATGSPVKLVLQITIDQLRGDLPRLYKERFGNNGFRYLMDKGVFFVNAHYMHADTETGPGHATLVTGGQPAQHGIIGGDWFDDASKTVVYSVEDENYKVLSEHVDTEPGKSGSGRSPANLQSTTIGDEIFIASEGRAKVFAVSGKDRSAIIPGGRAGKAFWLHHGDFVTSEFYYKQKPDWLIDWNNRKLADSYRDKQWDLLNDRGSYWRADKDDMPYEESYKHLGRTMPKKYAAQKDEHYYRGIEHSPVNDELVLSFSKALIDRENLGQGDTADYLSVSFSSTDLIGHTWGANSLEAEDNILRVDKNLADLFSYVDGKVGLDKTLIVLSADHGVPEITEFMQSLKFPAVRIDPKRLPLVIEENLKKKYSSSESFIEAFVYPYIYINEKTVEKLNLKMEDVEHSAADAAMKYPGISFAATRGDIMSGRLPACNSHMQRVANTFHAKRSGNIHLIADQHAILMHYPWNLKAALHGSVWSYDTYVPIMFVAPGVIPQVSVRPVGPQDIAPTISTYLGLKPPSGSVGVPLSEVFQSR